ncbi:MAG TPA: RNA polymerase sigma-70 factor [Bryobacteraceae bacterium]|jgi:RNA polymerase sigma-70 factor (ECF subfamily)|nr:RNA polymerase sigma-70 factor [Bryobacteraceae bacterium]
MPTASSEHPNREARDSRQSVRLATFDQYRGLLFSIAYRMLGSVADAEDMLQETFIRWQQTPGEDIRSARAFLVTIISRLSINHLQSARVQREEYFGHWLPEPLVAAQGSNPMGLIRVDETLSMAFLVLLERLTPIERAVFLLREVFEYDYPEIAEILDQSATNCRQILRRARQHMAQMRPRFEAPAKKQNELLDEFLRAAGSGDLDGLIGLLAKDVVLHTDGGGKGRAVPNLIHGPSNVARAIVLGREKFPAKGNVETRIVSVNGAPGVVSDLNGKPSFVLAMDTNEEHIHAIYFITNPDKLSRITNLLLDKNREGCQFTPVPE